MELVCSVLSGRRKEMEAGSKPAVLEVLVPTRVDDCELLLLLPGRDPMLMEM